VVAVSDKSSSTRLPHLVFLVFRNLAQLLPHCIHIQRRLTAIDEIDSTNDAQSLPSSRITAIEAIPGLSYLNLLHSLQLCVSLEYMRVYYITLLLIHDDHDCADKGPCLCNLNISLTYYLFSNGSVIVSLHRYAPRSAISAQVTSG